MAARLKHNPSYMLEDELLRSFVVRERDLAVILETVRDNTGPSNQHLLLLGPRGAGKTTLVNRAVAEIRRDSHLGRTWYPIVFDEESYMVTSAAELWFQALSHLADQTLDPRLEQARKALQPISDLRRLRDAALARLLEYSDAVDRRLLLVFENTDMLFDAQISDDDAWDVRHTLQNEPRIMVLATSTTRLDSFHRSEKPLYELFREHTLERLDTAECRAVWRLVTAAELSPDQARPIQILTGGNTRLLTTLAASAKHRSFRELMDDLVELVDDNTPHCKQYVEALPTESRKIFVALADLWSPATSRQVAEQTRGDIRAVSAQLGRLERQGIVEVVRRIDKTQLFQVTDRMYNLYHLLRRRGSDRIRMLVEFMVRFYDHEFAGEPSSTAEPLQTMLTDPSTAMQRFTDIASRLMDAAARGQAADAASVLADSPSAASFAPLLVALRRLAGESTDPPQEVREVADDITHSIERMRETLITRPAHTQQRHERKRSRSTR